MLKLFEYPEFITWLPWKGCYQWWKIVSWKYLCGKDWLFLFIQIGICTWMCVDLFMLDTGAHIWLTNDGLHLSCSLQFGLLWEMFGSLIFALDLLIMLQECYNRSNGKGFWSDSGLHWSVSAWILLTLTSEIGWDYLSTLFNSELIFSGCALIIFLGELSHVIAAGKNSPSFFPLIDCQYDSPFMVCRMQGCIILGTKYEETSSEIGEYFISASLFLDIVCILML